MRLSGFNPTAAYTAYIRPATTQSLQTGGDSYSSAAGAASTSAQGTDGLLKKLQEQRRALMNAGATLV